MTAPEEKTRKNKHWCGFVKAMTTYYKPTKNIILKQFNFRLNMQKDAETFAFCGCKLLEARHRTLKRS